MKMEALALKQRSNRFVFFWSVRAVHSKAPHSKDRKSPTNPTPSPTGLLAPGFKDLGDYFNRLCHHLETNNLKYDFLGASDWIANGERATNNTLLTVMYFKSPEGVRAFAHSSLHLEAWEWWKKNLKAHDHLSIYHEMFVSPAGSWETIYDNAEPMLMGATQWGVDGGKWVRATVDASEGVLKHSLGRMGVKA